MRASPTISAALAAALAALLLAACGGSNKQTSSGASGASHGVVAAANFAKYPDCMRSHGVTNFPDPQVRGHTVQIKLDPSVTESPAFNSAQSVCAHLLPAGGQVNRRSAAQERARVEGLLAFAACIRRHGFPSFPDPSSQGQLTVTMITQAGINLQQPAVQRVGDACVPASRGVITRADVARATGEGGGGG